MHGNWSKEMLKLVGKNQLLCNASQNEQDKVHIVINGG